MGADTKIEWATHTFNPWRGCTKVSDGCKHCYAETQAKRNATVLGVWGPQGTRVAASESMWAQPLKWNVEAQAAGERHRVFCASMADVFEGPETCSAEAYAVICEARVRLFDLIAKTPHLDWLLLTKRPENWDRVMLEVCRDDRWQEDGVSGAILCGRWYGMGSSHTAPSNVWMGTSVENQLVAKTRIPALLEIPARLRFLSCEPLLGPLELSNLSGWDIAVAKKWLGKQLLSPEGIGWVIAGGESGPNARPMHPNWARSLQKQCEATGTPFFFKQWGEWAASGKFMLDVLIGPDGAEHPKHQRVIVPNSPKDGSTYLFKVGKTAAGRLLDGRTWDEVPTLEETK